MTMETIKSWTHPLFETVTRLMEAKTGLVFRSHRYEEVEEAARLAMARMGIPDLEHYLQRLSSESALVEDLAAQLTVGESYFFREPNQFQWIRERILPEIVQRRGWDHPIRIWSAGCSSGEEAYSLAILMEEEGLRNHDIIQATDISEKALLKGRRAVYSSWSLRERTADWIQRYFRKEPGGFELEQRFRRRVRFEALNLSLDNAENFPPFLGGMDLILCRNVMIYFSHAAVEKVFGKLMDALAEGGSLVTGPSDPLFEGRFNCETLYTPAGIIYRKKSITNRDTAFSPFQAWSPPPLDFSLKSRSLATTDWIPKFPTAGLDPMGPPTIHEAELSETLLNAQGAFDRMDYDQVLQWTLPNFRAEAACQLAIRALANQQGTVKAEEAAEKAVRHHPLSPELHFLRAVLLMNMGKNREAVRSFRRTLYLDRTLAVAHFALGSVLRRLQDWDGAVKAFKNTLKLCQECPAGSPLRLSEGETPGQLMEAAQTQLTGLTSLVSRT